MWLKVKNPETVARAVQTSLKRRYVPPKDLDRMIREIEEESIEVFKDPVLVKDKAGKTKNFKIISGFS